MPAFLDAAARPHYGGKLRLSYAQTAETYEPALAATLPEQMIARAVYETLVRLDERGAASPGLAATWQSEAGGQRWTFQLRSDARFHNGAPVNAAAVRSSLGRSLARAQSAAAAELRRVHFVCAAPSLNTLACDLAEPLAALPILLADPALAIADAGGAGTGPWKIASWTKGARVRLEAYEDYPQGRPFLDAVEAEFGQDARRQRVDFELKRADVLVAAATEARPPGLVRRTPTSHLLVLGFSPSGPFLRTAQAGEREARHALLAAVDREALARLLPPGRAEPARTFLPGWVSGYEFLLEEQRTRVPSGALPRGAFRLLYDAADPVARLMASRLALDVRATGLELRPEGLPHAAFQQARESGQYDLYLESVRPRVDQPAGALADLFERYALEKVPVELFLPAGSTPSTVEIQYRLEQAALDRLRVLPLLHYSDPYSFQPGLEQVRLDENGMLDLANAWIR